MARCLFTLLRLTIAFQVNAQVNTATLLGTITDASGASLPGSRVTATNDETGFTHTVQAGADGAFLIPLLPIGDNYRLRVEAGGFRTATRAPNQVGQFVNLNCNALRGPKSSQTDLGLIRNLRLHESYKLQFRTESFQRVQPSELQWARDGGDGDAVRAADSGPGSAIDPICRKNGLVGGCK